MENINLRYMKKAIDLAKMGDSRVQPNPLVGAVIVKNGQIIGEGFHQVAGEGHAEVNAFLDCYSKGFSPQDSTMYVTLEPCSHFGKTPPCANRIVEEKVKKVVIACLDPNPKVAGKGIEILKKAGIEVEVGLLEEEAKKLNKIFFKYIKNKIPYVILKAASSLDGKIQTFTGNSQWISSEESREYSHVLRSKVKAIGVGVGTVILDNPSLTSRSHFSYNIDPIAIIFDSKLRTPINSFLVSGERKEKTIIVTTSKADEEKKEYFLSKKRIEIIEVETLEHKVDLDNALKKLGELGISSILIEGGGELNFSFIEKNLVDEYLFFIAPIIIGGKNAKTSVEGDGFAFLTEAQKIEFESTQRIGRDVLIKANKICE